MTKDPDRAICHEYCKPCEWYGICPHSYAEYDEEVKQKEKESKE